MFCIPISSSVIHYVTFIIFISFTSNEFLYNFPMRVHRCKVKLWTTPKVSKWRNFSVWHRCLVLSGTWLCNTRTTASVSGSRSAMPTNARKCVETEWIAANVTAPHQLSWLRVLEVIQVFIYAYYIGIITTLYYLCY